MKKTEYLNLIKDLNRLSIERKSAESNWDWDTVEYLDKKRNKLLIQIDNATIIFNTTGGQK